MSKSILEFAITLIGIYISLWVAGIIISAIPIPEGGFAIGANLIRLLIPDPNQELLLNLIRYVGYTGAYSFGYWKLR